MDTQAAEQQFIAVCNDPIHAKNCAVLITNFPPSTKPGHIKAMASTYGTVRVVEVPEHADTWAVVIMDSHENAKTLLMRTDGFNYKNNELAAQWYSAADTPPSPPDVATRYFTDLVKNPAEAANCGVYVSNLDAKVTVETLKGIAGSCGECVTIHSKSQSADHYSAIIVMSANDAAKRVMQRFQHLKLENSVSYARWAHIKGGKSLPTRAQERAKPTLAHFQTQKKVDTPAAAVVQQKVDAKPPLKVPTTSPGAVAIASQPLPPAESTAAAPGPKELVYVGTAMDVHIVSAPGQTGFMDSFHRVRKVVLLFAE